ncbi:AAA family ATPase [Micromonospora chalcea]|uniref:AAA family ATPase n=1 Tax=Micromonospora chalcea TaxID=1874 RepID=UPI0038F63D34
MTIDAASILADATKAKEEAEQVAARAKERSVLAWQPVDIAALIGAGLKLPETALLERKDGLHLFYPARLHSLIGEPGSLKTWVALLAAYQEIRKANRVLFLDYEDNPSSVVGRMLNFGLSAEDLTKFFIYIKPDAPISEPAKAMLKELVDADPVAPVTLVIIDGVTEVMSAHGWKVNDQEDVAAFYSQIAKWFTSLGPAAVMIDHVTKSKDSRGKDAIGAQHKRAGIDGASYVVTLVDPFAQGKHGKSYLTLAKDKNGTVQSKVERDMVGTFQITSDPATFAIEAWIDLPGVVTVPSAAGGATLVQLQQVCSYVKANPMCTASAAAASAGGTKKNVLAGIKYLVAQSFLEDRNTGGNGMKLVWIRDYDTEVPGLEDM